MSRPLAAALLNQSAITALVANRRALDQLPAGMGLPALVYSVVSIDATAYLDYVRGYETMRLQLNPLATSIAQVQQIHDAARAALDGMAQTELAGHRVIAVRRAGSGPQDSATDDAGQTIHTWPRDYIVIFEPIE